MRKKDNDKLKEKHKDIQVPDEDIKLKKGESFKDKLKKSDNKLQKSKKAPKGRKPDYSS